MISLPPPRVFSELGKGDSMLGINAISHLHDDDLELYLRGRLEPERLPSTEYHLQECKVCRSRLSKCVGHQLSLRPVSQAKTHTEQKRSEPRFATEGEGTLQEIHPISFDRHKVRVVNVSKNGIGILSSKAILPGTIVQLRINDILTLGNVRHCSALKGAEFLIGLRLHGEG